MEQGGEYSPEMLAFFAHMESAAVAIATSGPMPDEAASLYGEYASRIVKFVDGDPEMAQRTMEALFSALAQHVCLGEEFTNAVQSGIAQGSDKPHDHQPGDNHDHDKKPEAKDDDEHDSTSCKACQNGSCAKGRRRGRSVLDIFALAA